MFAIEAQVQQVVKKWDISYISVILPVSVDVTSPNICQNSAAWTVNKHAHNYLCPTLKLGGCQGSNEAISARVARWGKPHIQRFYACKLFFHARFLDRPRHRQGCYPSLYRGRKLVTGGPGIPLHWTSTHIWERITTVSSWNATAAASPMSRPRKMADKKVTTHITCKDTVDGNIIDTSRT